jgi:hypothetical protein
MTCESRISFRDQLTIEPRLAAAGFITCNEKDSSPFRVEGERYTPDSTGGVKPQLLHVCVARAVERIHARPSELRAELLEQGRVREQFILHLLGQCIELGVEIFMKENVPHTRIMYLDTYVVNTIFDALRW